MSDENDVTYWTAVLHRAAQAHHTNPNDAEARDTVQLALQNIQEINEYQNRRVRAQAMDKGAGHALLAGAARGMSFGLGDLAQSFTNTPEQTAAEKVTGSEHPAMRVGGEVLGSLGPTVAKEAPAALRLGGKALRAVGGPIARRLGMTMEGAAAREAPAAARAVGRLAQGTFRDVGPRPAGAAGQLEETAANLAEAKAVRGTPIQRVLRSVSRAVHGEEPAAPSEFHPLGPKAFGGQTAEEIASGVRRSAIPGRPVRPPEPDAVRTALVEQVSQRSPESFASPEVMARVQRGAPQSQLVYQAKRLLGRPPSPQSEMAVRALFANMPQQARQTAVQEFVQNVGQAPQAWVPILTNILERP